MFAFLTQFFSDTESTVFTEKDHRAFYLLNQLFQGTVFNGNDHPNLLLKIREFQRISASKQKQMILKCTKNIWKTMKQARIDITDHEALYAKALQVAIKSSEHLKILIQGMEKLRTRGVDFHKNKLFYEALIQNPNEATMLANCFIRLGTGIAFFKHHKRLYQSLMENARDAKILTDGFIRLRQANMPYRGHEELYKALIATPSQTPVFVKGFIALRKSKLPFNKNNKRYYKAIIDTLFIKVNLPFYTLSDAFDVLQKSYVSLDLNNRRIHDLLIEHRGCAYPLALAYQRLMSTKHKNKEQQTLWKILIKNPFSASDLSISFKILLDSGVSFKGESKQLYQFLIDRSLYSEIIAESFQMLLNQNIPFDDHHKPLFKMLSKAYNAPILAQLFLIFRTANMPGNQETPAWYQQLIKQHNFLDKAANVIECFQQIRAQFDKVPRVYKLPFDKLVLSEEVLAQLVKSGYDLKWHAFLYEQMFKRVENLIEYPVYQTMNLLNTLDNYAHENGLVDNSNDTYYEQCDAIQGLIDTHKTTSFTYGPLNKNQATMDIERLLKKVANTPIDDLDMVYDKRYGYILTVADSPPVYVNLLLRAANLSHLTLNEALIKKLGEHLLELEGDDINISEYLSSVAQQLPKVSQMALTAYLSYYYRNMNKLFRGEPQFNYPEAYCIWKKPLDGKINLLLNFICGCLANDAANKLLVLSWQLKEKQRLTRIMEYYRITDVQSLHDKCFYQSILDKSKKDGLIDDKEHANLHKCFENLSDILPNHTVLDRGERVTYELMDQRLANAQPLPSTTSFSTRKGGLSGFYLETSTRTTVIGTLHYPVANRLLDELIVPHGECGIYNQKANGDLFMSLVRSPGVIASGSYAAMVALAHAYKHYLRKPYKDKASKITIEGYTIHRPNHGLAHTYRVIEMIPLIFDYFAHHAKDESFKEYCQSASIHDRECLQIAAAFSITGRDSEVSASMDIKRYNTYREASQIHLGYFLKQHSPKVISRVMKKRLAHVVRYMGNPAYEKKFAGRLAINNHENEVERTRRDYFHRILTIAHNMDLVRCYPPDNFKCSLSLCRRLSEDNPEQLNHFNRLVEYNIELCKVHGDMVRTDIMPDGTFIPCTYHYESPFQEVSTSLKRLFDISQTVPRPEITEPYAFSCAC